MEGREIRGLENVIPLYALSFSIKRHSVYSMIGMNNAPAPALVYASPSPMCKCSLQLLWSVAFDWELVLLNI